jgi:hypothetical protein
MIPTAILCADIVRYLSLRNVGRWACVSEIADHIWVGADLVFDNAIDLARCRGWIVVEGKSPTRRARLTEAGLRLLGTHRYAYFEDDRLTSGLRSAVAFLVICEMPLYQQCAFASVAGTTVVYADL